MKRLNIQYAILIILLVSLGCVRIAKEMGESNNEEGIISQKRALQIAHNAIKGYEHYDKSGEITVELKKDQYIVTFPHGLRKEPHRPMPDYAMQVVIDAKSGKVLQIRAGS